MQALFTYGGIRRTALSPRTVLLGFNPPVTRAYEFETDASGRAIGYTSASLRALFDAGDVDGLRTAILYLNQWFDDAGAWYGDAIGRASGGKYERRYAEAQQIVAYEKPMVPQAMAYLSTLAAKKAASTDSAAGVVIPGLPNTLVAKASTVPAAQGLDPKSLIIPIGAALAALFFLKGH